MLTDRRTDRRTDIQTDGQTNLIVGLVTRNPPNKTNMRLVRNFRKSSVPIGKKMPHLRKGKATEYLAWVWKLRPIRHLFKELISAWPKNDTCILVTTGDPVNNAVVTQTWFLTPPPPPTISERSGRHSWIIEWKQLTYYQIRQFCSLGALQGADPKSEKNAWGFWPKEPCFWEIVMEKNIPTTIKVFHAKCLNKAQGICTGTHVEHSELMGTA